MADSVITINSLKKAFGSRQVLTGVDLDVPAGAIVGLVGTNGSGKSTLIKCLLGLLRKTSGTVSLFGEDSWNLSASAKSRLGYVPQTVRLYPWMKVKHIVAYTSSFYEDWDEQWAATLLDRWELPLEHRIGPLSPGQLQKLALVLALGYRPELLILDEPVASLDPVARRGFLRSLLELCQENEHTILFSTHITSDLERVASHLAILKEGQIALFDELDNVKDQVKRFRIKAASSLPADFTVPGALRCAVDGKQAVAAVTRVDDQLVSELRHQWQADVVVEDLNLEEIFLEYHHV
ncbi:ABC transporter ATP-binding protein [Schlesneria sp.]|uniref:ABC transporter ATP-binding protein n=1 Tax=Schlesneria sp. TaxID=2762018 RepID=UPI002F0F10DB